MVISKESKMVNKKITISDLKEDDLSFLFDLWHTPEVMRYADEFPRYRGWSKSDDYQLAWKAYQTKRDRLGYDYTQLILWLDDLPIGESFFVILPENYTFGKWAKPNNTKSLMGDIKLLPEYWGRGLGSEGMCLVVRFFFTNTDCELLVVPPHRLNPAANRVYRKAGFVLFTGMRSWRNHKIMELTRGRYQELYE